MFDVEKKKGELTFSGEPLSLKRKALIALLGVAGILGCVNGYMQHAEKMNKTSVGIEKLNKMPLMLEHTR